MNSGTTDSTDGPEFVGLDSVCLARTEFEASHIAALLRASGIRVYIWEEALREQTTVPYQFIPVWVKKPCVERARKVILEARLAGVQFTDETKDPESTED